jgi:hypothetical protein
MANLMQRLNRLEDSAEDINGGRCPLCAGRDGMGFNARIFIDGGDGTIHLQGAAGCYDEDGRCRRCGAVARDIVLTSPRARSKVLPPKTG